ncbi:MAG: hypothetical protein IJY01_02000 [Clostridia bacterium]|nr:hypothetical protein [Clostridia bacterium]MBQ8289628.1 hypothetical protein [Clostridia bacterium]
MPFYILLFCMSAALFVALCVFIMPRLLLKNSYRDVKLQDRGLKKFRLEGGGFAITYEPAGPVRRYIDQYILSVRDGVKSITYKVAVGIRLIDIDILLYDADGVAFLSLNSKNILDGQGHVQTVKLPMRCAYVSVQVNQVDAMRIENRRELRINPLRLGIYFTLTLALSVGFAFIARLCLGNILGGVFREDFLASQTQVIATLICALITGLLLSGLTLLFIILRKRER